MAQKKGHYLGARLTDDAMEFLKKDFGKNLSLGIQTSIDVYRNVTMLALVDIRKQQFNEKEIKALLMLKGLNQSLDDATLELVCEQHNTNVRELKTKLDNLGRIEKYILFEQLGLYDLDSLKKTVCNR